MSLDPGARLGRFEIEAPVGAGGMGEVYRAVDTTVGRPVAVKILPESVRADTEQLERLRREARALGALNHPNIATLYGLEEDGGVVFLVMELVAGATLADLVRERRLDQDRTLEICEQIAEALAYAHDQGIVHRDLKPSNVMVGPQGRVKLLDFGIAKRRPIPADADLPTSTIDGHGTAAGVQLGTVPYMSPEQVRGEPLDGRADIWAFGSLVYELLSGRAPFTKPTTAETIAAILQETPDLDRLPKTTPTRIRLLIERCLRKDRERRLHHAADARIELADARGLVDGVSAPADHGARPRDWWARPWVPAVAVGLGLLAGAGIAGRWGRGGEVVSLATGGPLRFTVPLPQGLAIFPGEVQSYLAMSPDGRQLVIAGTGRTALQLHDFADGTTRPIPDTADAATPTFSPDGRSVAFFAQGRLKRVDLGGGAPAQTLIESAWEAGSSWGTDGTLLFSQRSPRGIEIFRVPENGGDAVAVTHVDPEREIGHVWPQFLPDGRRFLYLSLEKSPGEDPKRTLYLASLDGGDSQPIRGVASRAVYSANGFLLYVATGALVARPFDPARATFIGAPIPVADRLRYFRMTGQAEFAVSQHPDRPMVAFHGGPWTNELVRYDRAGRRMATVGERAPYDQLRISPDGTHAVVSILDAANGGRDLWTYELATNRARRLTLHPPDEQSPVWSPDGRRVVFRSDVAGPPDLYVQDASGGGAPELLLSRPAVLNPEDWSPDGRLLLYQVASRATGADQWLLPIEAGGKPRALLNTRFSEWGGRFSPDGQLVAFVSDESGAYQIYLAPVDDPGARHVVSTSGGTSPRWSGDGRALFYLGAERSVRSVSIETEPELTIGAPQVLFELEARVHAGMFDVFPDGSSFIVNQVIEDVRTAPVNVIVNWISEPRAER